MTVGSKLPPTAGASLLATWRVGASLLATVGSKLPPTLATFALSTAIAAAAPLPGLGPLQIGMPLEELRAATPGVEWTAGRPMKFSGTPTEFKADGLRIADIPFSAEVYSGHHGRYGLVLEHASAAADADQCESSARAVFTVIETQTGPMRPSAELIKGEEAEPIGAYSTVMLSQLLRQNDTKGILRAKLKSRNPYQRWLRASTPSSNGLRGNPATVDTDSPGLIAASFAMDYRADGSSEACRIRLTAMRSASPPPLAVLPFATLSAAQTPSISRRHFELSRLTAGTELPANGVELSVRCKVDRDSGRTRDCQATPEDSLPAPYRNTASRLARAYQFDMAKVPALDRDNPQPVLVDIPVRLSTQDIRSLNMAKPAVPYQQAGFRWAMRATPTTLEQLYPRRALRSEEQTNVLLICELQEDFSPVCAPASQDPRPSPDFEWAALEILTFYRAEPKTVAGQPTAGIRFLQNLQFKIQ